MAKSRIRLMWLGLWLWAFISLPLLLLDLRVVCQGLDDAILIFLILFTGSEIGTVFRTWRTAERLWNQEGHASSLVLVRGTTMMMSMGVVQMIAQFTVTILAITALLTPCPRRAISAPLIMAATTLWALVMGWWHLRWANRAAD